MPQSVSSVTSDGSSSITTRLKLRTKTSSPTIGSEDLSSNASVSSPATVTLRRSVRSSVLARRSAEPEIRSVSSPLRRSRRLSIQSDDGVLNNRSEESKKNSSKTNGTEKSELNSSNHIEKTKRRSIKNNDIETRNVQSPVLRITRLSQSLSPENVKPVEISTRRTRAWAAASALSGIREELKEDSPKNMKSVSTSAEKSAEMCKNKSPCDENNSEKYHVNTNSKTITAENKSIITNESIVTPKKSPNTRKSAEYNLKMESEVNINSIEKKKPLKKRLSLSSDCTSSKQSPEKIEKQPLISRSETKSIEEHVVNDSNEINVSISSKSKATPVVVISKELIDDVCLKQNSSECKISDNDITVSNTCDEKMSENVVIVLNNCNKSMNKINDNDISTVKLNIVCDEDKILNTDAMLETVTEMREIVKDESIELNDSSDVSKRTDVPKIIIPNESKEEMISDCVDNKCNETELNSNKISSKLTDEDIEYLNSSESKLSKVIFEKDSKESESDSFSLRVDESSMSEKSDTLMKSDTATKKTELISPCKKKYSLKNSYESSTYDMDKNEESKGSLDNADINLFYEKDHDNCISQVSNESDKNSEIEDSNKFVLELDNEKDSQENSEDSHLTAKTDLCIIATNDSDEIKIIENKNSQKENENIMKLNLSLKDSPDKSLEKSEIIESDEGMFINSTNVNKGEVDKNILNLSSNKNDENTEECNKDELIIEKGETNFVNKLVILNESSGEVKGISKNIDIIDSFKIGTDKICEKLSATNSHSPNKIKIIDVKTRNEDAEIKFQQKEKTTKTRLSRKVSSEDSNDEEIIHKKRKFIKKQNVRESLSKFESSDSEHSLKIADLNESIHNSSDSNENVDHSESKNLSENTKSDETSTSSYNEENRTDFNGDEDEKKSIEHKDKSDQKSVKKTIHLCNESNDESNSGSSDYFDNEAMECDGTDTPSDGSNDIPVKGESLGESDTDENTTDSYEEGSFVVDNLSAENDLLSGTGDDLSGTGDDLSGENFSVDSDDLLTQSKKDKTQFNIKKRKRSRIIVQSSSEDEKDKEIKSLYENLLRKLNDSSESKEKQAENEDDLKLKTISERKEKNKEAESEVHSETYNKNTIKSEEDSETLEKVESKMKKEKTNDTSESENEDIFYKNTELKKFVGTDELNLSSDDGAFCEDLKSKRNLGKKTRSQELLFSEKSDDKKHEIVKDSDSETEKGMIKPNTEFSKLKKSEVMPFNQDVIEISTDYTSSDNQKMFTKQKENKVKDKGKVSLNAKKISKDSSSTILQLEDSDKNESDWGSLTVMINVSPQVNSTITETISVSDNSCSSLSGEEIKKKVTNPSTKNISKKIDNQADLNDDSEMETIIINEGSDALGEDYNTESRIQNKKNENLSCSFKSDSSFKESQKLKKLTTERKSLNILIDGSEINKSIKSMSDNEGIEENTSKSISSVEECDFTDLSSTSISKSKKYIRKRNRKSKSFQKSRNEEIDLEKSLEVSEGTDSVKNIKDASIISTENESIHENLVLEISNEDVEISSQTSESKKHKRRNKRESLSRKKSNVGLGEKFVVEKNITKDDKKNINLINVDSSETKSATNLNENLDHIVDEIFNVQDDSEKETSGKDSDFSQVESGKRKKSKKRKRLSIEVENLACTNTSSAEKKKLSKKSKLHIDVAHKLSSNITSDDGSDIDGINMLNSNEDSGNENIETETFLKKSGTESNQTQVLKSGGRLKKLKLKVLKEHSQKIKKSKLKKRNKNNKDKRDEIENLFKPSTSSFLEVKKIEKVGKQMTIKHLPDNIISALDKTLAKKTEKHDKKAHKRTQETTDQSLSDDLENSEFLQEKPKRRKLFTGQTSKKTTSGSFSILASTKLTPSLEGYTSFKVNSLFGNRIKRMPTEKLISNELKLKAAYRT